jgi:hypothetical protein
MTNPTTNFGWQMPTATDLVTDLPADFEIFGQAVDTDFVDLLGGTTGQVLSKTSATDLDFTWVTPQIGDITAITVTAPITGGGTTGSVGIAISAASTSASGAVQLSDSTSTTSSVLAATPTAVKAAYDLAAAAIAKSTVTTAGDIIYRNATVPVRLGIGTANQVLKVNSGATAPEWGTVSSGSFTKITSSTFSAQTAVSINSCFTATYQNYRIIVSLTGVSADANLRYYLRASGTDNTGTGQGSQAFALGGNSGTSNLIVQYGVSAFWSLIELDGAANVAAYSLSMDMYRPNEAVRTTGTWSGSFVNQSGVLASNFGGGLNDSATQWDGFTLSPSAGNISGKVVVYGYEN